MFVATVVHCVYNLEQREPNSVRVGLRVVGITTIMWRIPEPCTNAEKQ